MLSIKLLFYDRIHKNTCSFIGWQLRIYSRIGQLKGYLFSECWSSEVNTRSKIKVTEVIYVFIWLIFILKRLKICVWALIYYLPNYKSIIIYFYLKLKLATLFWKNELIFFCAAFLNRVFFPRQAYKDLHTRRHR